MDILAIIVVGLILITILGVVLVIFYGSFLFLIRFLPIIIGLVVGIIMWFSGNRIISNLLVGSGIFLQILLGRHLKKSNCNCFFHKTVDF